MSNVITFPTKSEPKIEGYIHCKKCRENQPDNMSISEYSDYDVGLTEYGIEIWCNRHNESVMYFNLMDIWEIQNILKNVRGEIPMPIIEADLSKTDRLIHTGVTGVYIDPDQYWDGETPRLEHLQWEGSFFENGKEESA